MSKRTVLSISVIVIAAVAVVAAVFISKPKPGRKPEKASSTVEIVRGPYLQVSEDSGIVLSWVTSEPATSHVFWTFNEEYEMPPGVNDFKESEPAIHHRVKIGNVSVGDPFSYAIHHNPAPEDTLRLSFPLRAFFEPGNKTFRFVVYGDSRYNPAEHAKVAAAIVKEEPLFVINTGDFVTDGRKSEQWDTDWFEPAKDMLAKIPVVPVLGNHEFNAAEYYEIFDAATGGAPDYVRVIGDVEIIVIDTNRDFLPGSPSEGKPPSSNYLWIKEKLEAPRKAKWRIVCMHNPAFSSGKHGPSKNVQYALVPLFSKHKPDIVFCGHDHGYERSVFDGVTYITAAGGGAPLYKKSRKNPFSKVFKSAYHYVLVEIDGDTMTLTAREPDGTVIDTTTISVK